MGMSCVHPCPGDAPEPQACPVSSPIYYRGCFTSQPMPFCAAVMSCVHQCCEDGSRPPGLWLFPVSVLAMGLPPSNYTVGLLHGHLPHCIPIYAWRCLTRFACCHSLCSACCQHCPHLLGGSSVPPVLGLSGSSVAGWTPGHPVRSTCSVHGGS